MKKKKYVIYMALSNFDRFLLWLVYILCESSNCMGIYNSGLIICAAERFGFNLKVRWQLNELLYAQWGKWIARISAALNQFCWIGQSSHLYGFAERCVTLTVLTAQRDTKFILDRMY